ncbi:MAG: hypothetical protein DRN66_00155 [Candidatus Nanohalarchaeota archaeon]|nr:MAG: hypothetical protein DRN66_00155 [Candidatus Nanohaloarchaeota archaeon]
MVIKKAEIKYKDKWLKKKWIPIKPPVFLGNEIIGHTVFMKNKSPLGRITHTSLGTLTKNVRDHNVTLKFKLNEISEGNICMTKYMGQEINKNQIMMAVRRGSSRIDNIEILKFDNEKIRIKTVLITTNRVSTAVMHSLRAKVKKEIQKECSSSKTIENFLPSVNAGKLQAEIVRRVKTIYPCREMIVRKIEVIA